MATQRSPRCRKGNPGGQRRHPIHLAAPQHRARSGPSHVLDNEQPGSEGGGSDSLFTDTAGGKSATWLENRGLPQAGLKDQPLVAPRPPVCSGAGDSHLTPLTSVWCPDPTPRVLGRSLPAGTEPALARRMCTMATGPSRPSTATPASSTSPCTATTTATSSPAAGRPTRCVGLLRACGAFGRGGATCSRSPQEAAGGRQPRSTPARVCPAAGYA